MIRTFSFNYGDSWGLEPLKIPPSKKQRNCSCSFDSEEYWNIALSKVLKADDPDEMINLIQTGLFQNIEEGKKEEVYKFALDSLDVIFECAQYDLPKNYLNNFFDLAVKDNDIELIELLISEAENRGQLDYFNWHQNPFEYVNELMDLRVNRTIIDLIISKSEVDLTDFEEYDWRNFLANLWNLDGKFRLKNVFLEYSGSYIHHFTDKILSSIEAFDFINPSEKKLIHKVIDCSRDSISFEEKLKMFNSKEPIMVHGGYKKHHIELIFWKISDNSGVMLFCNKGFLAETPVEAYLFDPTLLNKKILAEIYSIKNSASCKKVKAFYSNLLIDQLLATSYPELTNVFEDEWIDEDLEQTGDNCVWESLRAAIYGVAGLHAWIENDCKVDNEITLLIGRAFKQIQPWDEFVGLFSLMQYLKRSLNDPVSFDRSLCLAILKKAQARMTENEIDYSLYEEALSLFIRVRNLANLSGQFSFRSLIDMDEL